GVEIDQDGAALRSLGKANREVRRHGRDTQAALRGEDGGDVSRLTGRRRYSTAEPHDLFERRDEVVPLDRPADELEGARTDDLDDEVGRRALPRGKDDRSGQRARQRPDDPGGLFRWRGRSLLVDFDDDQVGAPGRRLVGGLPCGRELSDDDYGRTRRKDALERGGRVRVGVDDDGAKA